MKHNPSAHKLRRTNVHGLFLILGLIMFLIYAFGCSPKSGCPAVYKNRLQGYGWLKNRNTNKVFILDKEGAILCTYFEPVK